MLDALVSGKLAVLKDSNLHVELTRLAGSWPTCAAGVLCKRLPRTGKGAPCDYILYAEGLEFLFAVRIADWRMARVVLSKIEDRTALLLQE